jgi:truncated hemoglobin YjbI
VSEHPTLFEWAGRGDAFDRLINAFYDRVEQDALLSPFFPGGVYEEHRRNVATWWSEVFGGTGGRHRSARRIRADAGQAPGLGISDEQRFRFASLMSLAADDAGRVPAGKRPGWGLRGGTRCFSHRLPRVLGGPALKTLRRLAGCGAPWEQHAA